MAKALASSRALSPDRGSTGFWDGKLGYAHAWVVLGAWIGLGVLLHLWRGPAPAQLVTVGVLALPPLAAAIAVRTNRHSPFCHWLSGIPLAVVSTIGVLSLAMLGGILPQAAWQRVGVDSPWGTWPFLLASQVLCVNLAACTSKRIWPLTYPNLKFTLSHLGLLIAIAGGSLSSAMLERRNLVLFEGVPTTEAYDPAGNGLHLPFEATLRRFTLETFPPVLAVAEVASDGSAEKVVPAARFVQKGSSEDVGGYRLEVLEYYPAAVFAAGQWRSMPWKTAAPAARVRATQNGRLVAEGWVSPGSIDVPSALLPVAKGRVIALPPPRPKKFHSKLEVRENGQIREVEVEVNKPASVAGYRLYQVSYDDKLGAASEYSVVEAVRDRSVPFVYFGLGLMLCGAALQLLEGTKKGDKR